MEERHHHPMSNGDRAFMNNTSSERTYLRAEGLERGDGVTNESYENDELNPMGDDEAFEYETEDAEVWHGEDDDLGSEAEHNLDT